jgi:hypothetical protein
MALSKLSTIHASAFKRSQLVRVRTEFKEIARPGVYLLLGENMEGDRIAYVGESNKSKPVPPDQVCGPSYSVGHSRQPVRCADLLNLCAVAAAEPEAIGLQRFLENCLNQAGGPLNTLISGHGCQVRHSRTHSVKLCSVT